MIKKVKHKEKIPRRFCPKRLTDEELEHQAGGLPNKLHADLLTTHDVAILDEVLERWLAIRKTERGGGVMSYFDLAQKAKEATTLEELREVVFELCRDLDYDEERRSEIDRNDLY